jgi:hypothetical protein
MDSLERLAHSLEAAVALIQSLRRENRELAHAASEASARAAKSGEMEGLKYSLEAAKTEIERLRQEPAVDLEAQERARQAELEAAGMAMELEEERKRRQDGQRQFEAKIGELELRLLAAERYETMPMPAATPQSSTEVENLSRRCAELEVMLAEAQASLEKSRGDITAMQVRIAESADPGEVSAWQSRLQELSSELEGLRQLKGTKEKLDLDRAEVRKQKRALAAVFQEREMTRKRLDEIHTVLDNLRLS